MPKDSEGNICGVDEYASKPWLFYFDATKCFEPSLPGEECPGTTKLCVQKCPDEFSSLATVDINGLLNDIAYYAKEVTDMDNSNDPMKNALDSMTITKPENLFCVRQSYAAVKDVAETLIIDSDPTSAATELLTLGTNGDCNLYTIPSQVRILKLFHIINY